MNDNHKSFNNHFIFNKLYLALPVLYLRSKCSHMLAVGIQANRVTKCYITKKKGLKLGERRKHIILKSLLHVSAVLTPMATYYRHS